tara:strand:- start:278 stop:391 length:114 start_codon:yes stop_codon:yes gene_type:complete
MWLSNYNPFKMKYNRTPTLEHKIGVFSKSENIDFEVN